MTKITQPAMALRANEQLQKLPCPAGLVSVTNQFGVVCLRFKKTEQAHEFVRACREFLGKGGGR